MAVCKECNGTGYIDLPGGMMSGKCKTCNGTGQINDGPPPSYSIADDDDDEYELDDVDDVTEALETVYAAIETAVAEDYSKKGVAKSCSILCKFYLKRHDFYSALNKNDEAKKDLKAALYLASPKQLVFLKGMGVSTNIDDNDLDNYAIEEHKAGHHAVAAYLFEKSMEMGNIYAPSNLGVCYYNGEGVPQDQEKAFELYQKPAEQGNASAQRNLGTYYREVKKDYAKAREWYNKAIANGNEPAKKNLKELDEEFSEEKAKIDKALKKALEYWDENECEKAIDVWKSLGNDPEALWQIGDCYFNGYGNLKEDNNKAVEYFRPSAEQGYAKAQNDLGLCYENGYGISKDSKKAFEWYSKAAEQGFAISQRKLGYFYHIGEGVSKNFNKAVEWYIKAAEQGDALAQSNLGYCYEEGEGVSKNINKAVEWYSKAAEQGNAWGQNNLGVCYRDGLGVKKNYAKAEELLKKAAEQGHDKAKENLKKLKKIKNKKVERLVGVGIVVGIIGVTVLLNIDSINSTVSSFTGDPKTVLSAGAVPITSYVIPSEWQHGQDKNIAKNTTFYTKTETIDNQQKNVLTVTANLPGGSKWNAGQVVLERTKPTLISKIRLASGVRFKVLGDGKTWRLTFPTRDTEKDWCLHEYIIRTDKNKVMEINVPYTSLKQPSWGKQVPFKKDDITSVVLQTNTDLTSGSSTIKVFDFGIW